MDNILDEVRKELKRHSDPEKQISGRRFFKEKITLYGLKSSLVNKIAKDAIRKMKNPVKTEIFNYCEDLWQSGYLEESFIACNWAYLYANEFVEEDFHILEKWLHNYVSNWASCDTFCNHSIGTFLEMYPAYLSELKKWAISDNRWVRRGAAVSLIIPARKGLFLKEIFTIADILLTDQDDLVQKGYGWMLKVASEVHQQEVLDYVLKHKMTMPRTALRYAIEKMPSELRKKAMEKD